MEREKPVRSERLFDLVAAGIHASNAGFVFRKNNTDGSLHTIFFRRFYLDSLSRCCDVGGCSGNCSGNNINIYTVFHYLSAFHYLRFSF